MIAATGRQNSFSYNWLLQKIEVYLVA